MGPPIEYPRKKFDFINSKTLLLAVFLIILMLILIIGDFSIWDWIQKTFQRTIGYSPANILFKSIKTMVITSAILGIIFLIINELAGPKLNRWFIIGLISMYLAFLVGFSFIDTVVGVKAIDGWNLKYEGNGTIIGKVYCHSSLSGKEIILVNETARCVLNYNLRLYASSSRVDIKYLDGSQESKYSNDSETITFLVNPHVEYLTFYVSGANLDKNMVHDSASVGYYHTFLTREEYDKNMKTFLVYVLGLIAVIFVTVPLSISEIRKMWEHN